jgi:branched-chain amino acid transport system substrate-binding protein
MVPYPMSQRPRPRRRRGYTFTVGCLYPLTGRAARYGHDSIIGAEMAADEVNASGGVLGREVRLLFVDDRSDPTFAVKAAQRYVLEDDVDALMGVVSSAVALAVTEVSRHFGVLFVGTDHASARLTEEQFQPYYFRVTNNTRQSMTAGARYLGRRPWRRFAYIGPDYEYGHRQWQDFREALTRLLPDARVVGTAWPKLYAPDYRPALRSILDAGPEVLVHGFWGGDTVAFVAQALELGVFDRVQVVSFDAGGNYEVFEALGERMPCGLILSARHHNNFPPTAANRRFVQGFRDRARRYPAYPAHGAYVGVHFLAAAVARAGSVETEEVVRAGEGLVLATPRDREGQPSWIDPASHQVVQEMYIGVTEPQADYPPARVMLGQWEVIPAEAAAPRSRSERVRSGPHGPRARDVAEGG